MKTIFNIIALPVTLTIWIACFLFASLFETSLKTQNGVTAFKRIYRDSRDLALRRYWQDMSPLFNALISCIVYYAIFG